MPACAEEMMVMRDVLLAELTGGRLHIAHVSTRGAVEIIRWAKSRGLSFTAETCPHYFALTDEAVSGYDAAYKVNPPLRTEADRAAIKEALRDGTIDAIATDHAPHLAAEKETEFERAPFGLIGFETAFALGIMELVRPGVLTLMEYIAKLTREPARIIGIPSGIVIGDPANLVVFDPDEKWTYTRESVRSGCTNSPFIGQELVGRIRSAVLNDRTFEF
jgi:dihydroorotase